MCSLGPTVQWICGPSNSSLSERHYLSASRPMVRCQRWGTIGFKAEDEIYTWRGYSYKCWVNKGQYNVCDINNIIFPFNGSGSLVLYTKFCSISSKPIFSCLNDHREVYFVKRAYTTNMKTESLQRKDFNNKSCKSCLKVRFSPIWHNKLFYHWTEFH